MTVGELRELLSQYPDYAPVEIRLVGPLAKHCNAADITTVSAFRGLVLIEPDVALDYFDPLAPAMDAI